MTHRYWTLGLLAVVAGGLRHPRLLIISRRPSGKNYIPRHVRAGMPLFSYGRKRLMLFGLFAVTAMLACYAVQG